jgi:hypothetical protein
MRGIISAQNGQNQPERQQANVSATGSLQTKVGFVAFSIGRDCGVKLLSLPCGVVLTFRFALFLVALFAVARVVTAATATNTLQKGEALARQVCASCHLFPEPQLLDKETWRDGALPHMEPFLGIKPKDVSRLGGAEGVLKNYFKRPKSFGWNFTCQVIEKDSDARRCTGGNIAPRCLLPGKVTNF